MNTNIIKSVVSFVKERFLPSHMKHVVFTKLEPGWHDVDKRMLHGCFELLNEFIEKDSGFKYIDWNSSEETEQVYKEMMSLYEWWNVTRKFRDRYDPTNWVKEPTMGFERIDTKSSKVIWEGLSDSEMKEWDRAIKKSMELHAKWNQEDEDNLVRLIKIRPYLWA